MFYISKTEAAEIVWLPNGSEESFFFFNWRELHGHSLTTIGTVDWQCNLLDVTGRAQMAPCGTGTQGHVQVFIWGSLLGTFQPNSQPWETAVLFSHHTWDRCSETFKCRRAMSSLLRANPLLNRTKRSHDSCPKAFGMWILTMSWSKPLVSIYRFSV